MTTESPTATFWVRQVATANHPPSCVLVGEVRRGAISPGMRASIPLNSSAAVTAQVSAVGHWGDSTDEAVWLQCDDPDEAVLLAGLNLPEGEITFHEGEPQS